MRAHTARGVTPAEFFALGLDGATMQAAHYATELAYSTVQRAVAGEPLAVPGARKLAVWSEGLASAIAARVRIDTALAAGIVAPGAAVAASAPSAAPATDPVEVIPTRRSHRGAVA